ncbi:glycosyltransferase [Bifidobacterium sp. UBA744]|uniref:glycosyltransferase n=1 Tax=Bifidobacterium sp. UBA744 TaxID=1946112 RepID=UPI0025C2094F|nr:glycosyltransferase family 2 protein [Bifidobacterium sp. UBA744]
MLKVSIIIPAWNEEERIEDCLTCAILQTVPPYEIIVVDNKSTDATVDVVRRFMDANPQANIKLIHQDAEQGLIPTRNAGLNAATGDVLGRIDADCMLKPDWVEVVTGIFTEDPKAMGASGPVVYYDMPLKNTGLRGDNRTRNLMYRADGGQTMLFGSNMALRASAWKTISGEVCRDYEDVMHEDVDISLHMLGKGLKTVYSPRMIVGMSARRMASGIVSFKRYTDRFKNTFAAHPRHRRTFKPEYLLRAIWPMLHILYPIYQRRMEREHIDSAANVWRDEQRRIARGGSALTH